MSDLTIYDELEQRSPEWYAARCGIVTASAIGNLITVGPPDASSLDCPACGAVAYQPCLSATRKVPTPIKTLHGDRIARAAELPPVVAPATGDTARGLLMLLASERISGVVEENAFTRDMERGVLAEPYARDLYAKHHAPVVEVGFMVREFDGFKVGYSPDGLVGDDGLIEIKAPRTKGQVATVIGGEVPAQYVAQCQAGMFVSGRSWCDFIPYVGGLPLWVKRVYPDPQWQRAIEATAARAETAINELVAAYQAAVEGLPPTKRIDYYEDVFI